MRRKRNTPSALIAARQRGQAALLTVLLMLGVGTAAIVYAVATPARISIENDKRTATVLARAKEALIGYAAKSDTPGILPCPDTDNDGSADSPCGVTGATAIGRLPWRTLGLEDLRDSSGECLWYAVSGNFKNSGVSAPAIVNSDSAGTLVVNDANGTPIYSGSNAALAIVFAPGSTLSSQDRNSSSTTVCGGNTTAANYLDGANQTGASTNIFVAGQVTDTFNDKLLAITSDALFSVVNVRVAKEAIAALESYRTANSYYPFANAYGSVSPYNCTGSLNRGRFPITPTGCGQAAWGVALPGWFSTNEWNLVTHYAMSKACGQLGLPSPALDALTALAVIACDTLGNLAGGGLLATINTALTLLSLPTLTDDPVTVTGVSSNVRALVVVTGRAQGAQVHTCASVEQCMEDTSNTDSDGTYVKPSRFPASNDRMALTCATSSPCSVLP